jgi:multidrug efflux pump subunit AcrB
VVHLCSAYLLELGRGQKKDEAILASAEDVGRACLLTSLTTFLGFAALSFVPAPAFRQLGIILGSCVGIALLLAVTLTRFSSRSSVSPNRGAKARPPVQDLLDRFLIGSERLSNAALDDHRVVCRAYRRVALRSLAGAHRHRFHQAPFAQQSGSREPNTSNVLPRPDDVGHLAVD